jgi:uncharacterized protein YoxC
MKNLTKLKQGEFIMHYCTVPIDLKKDIDGKVHYINCCKKAVAKVSQSSWYVCELHKEYAINKKWPLEPIPLEVVVNDN